MLGIRSRVYRLVFGLAGVYNLGFGLVAVIAPNGFLDLFRVDRPRYSAAWQVLGLVVGVYGLGYVYAALRLDRARPIIAIGLGGKVLGPIAWVTIVLAGEWPLRTLPLVVFSAVVWWLPFGLFLLEGTGVGSRIRATAPVACAGLNLAAAGALATVLRPGTEAGGSAAQRVAYIAGHPLAWRVGWALWVAAAISLLAFYAWWATRLSRRRLALAAVAVGLVGLACDMTAESLLIGWLPQDIERVGPLSTFLTGGLANGLYTVAGIGLTLLSGFRGWLAAWAWTMWAAGLALSGFAVTGNFAGVGVSTALLFALFCPWVVVMGRRLR